MIKISFKGHDFSQIPTVNIDMYDHHTSVSGDVSTVCVFKEHFLGLSSLHFTVENSRVK